MQRSMAIRGPQRCRELELDCSPCFHADNDTPVRVHPVSGTEGEKSARWCSETDAELGKSRAEVDAYPVREREQISYGFKASGDTAAVSTARADNGRRLTVRLLVACASARSTELLWLAAPRVCDEEGPVVGDELLLQLECLCRVLVLCRVGDNGFADGLADGVDLRRVTTACDADADVDVGECSGLEDEELPRASRSL